jgi:hypothetical protein
VHIKININCTRSTEAGSREAGFSVGAFGVSDCEH